MLKKALILSFCFIFTGVLAACDSTDSSINRYDGWTMELKQEPAGSSLSIRDINQSHASLIKFDVIIKDRDGNTQDIKSISWDVSENIPLNTSGNNIFYPVYSNRYDIVNLNISTFARTGMKIAVRAIYGTLNDMKEITFTE